eukprot:jgi/Mesvir1/15978/Mv08287-RA.1
MKRYRSRKCSTCNQLDVVIGRLTEELAIQSERELEQQTRYARERTLMVEITNDKLERLDEAHLRVAELEAQLMSKDEECMSLRKVLSEAMAGREDQYADIIRRQHIAPEVITTAANLMEAAHKKLSAVENFCRAYQKQLLSAKARIASLQEQLAMRDRAEESRGGGGGDGAGGRDVDESGAAPASESCSSDEEGAAEITIGELIYSEEGADTQDAPSTAPGDVAGNEPMGPGDHGARSRPPDLRSRHEPGMVRAS